MNKIGILTSGGDAPGMNAAIRAVVRVADKAGIEVIGIEDGYKGLVENRMYPLHSEDVSEVLQRGGTFLGTARLPEFVQDKMQDQAIENLKKNEIDCLIVIGGDGSYRGALALSKKGIQTIGIPGTIDNDIPGTQETIGFHTALNTIVDAVNKLRDTSSSHHRCFIVEVMGNHSDELALYSGIACGCEALITKYTHYQEDQIVNYMHYLEKHEHKRHAIIIASENILDVKELAQKVTERTNYGGKSIVLGHIQRGGSPVPEDRILASQMGQFAFEMLKMGETGKCVCKVDNQIISKEIDVALHEKNQYKEKLYQLLDELV